jgi:transposase InsO family protein
MIFGRDSRPRAGRRRTTAADQGQGSATSAGGRGLARRRTQALGREEVLVAPENFVRADSRNDAESAVTQHPTAEWLARQIVEAFPWHTAPRYLIRDNDGAYGQAFTSRVRRMGIRDRPIAARSPWQNPYVERLIGTLRRDCLDHILIFGEQHLHRILAAYSTYYNETRTHLGLAKDTPIPRAVQRSGAIIATPILSGLHHCYARI